MWLLCLQITRNNPCLSISYHSSTLLETLHSIHCFGSFGLMAIEVDDFVSITKVESYPGQVGREEVENVRTTTLFNTVIENLSRESAVVQCSGCKYLLPKLCKFLIVCGFLHALCVPALGLSLYSCTLSWAFVNISSAIRKFLDCWPAWLNFSSNLDQYSVCILIVWLYVTVRYLWGASACFKYLFSASLNEVLHWI